MSDVQNSAVNREDKLKKLMASPGALMFVNEIGIEEGKIISFFHFCNEKRKSEESQKKFKEGKSRKKFPDTKTDCCE